MLSIYVDDINDVPEELRSYYVEKDGKHMLDADYSSAGLENVAGLKSSQERIKSERNELREKYNSIKKFERLLDIEGFDVDGVEELIAKASTNGDPEAIERLQREYDKKLARKDADLNDYKTAAEQQSAKLKNFIISQEVTSAALSAGVLKGSVSDVVTLTKNNFGLDESGKVQVLDEDGDPLGITPSEFFSSVYKDKKPHYFEAVQATGSGAQPSASSGGVLSKSWTEASSSKEKVEVLKQKMKGK